MKQKKKLKNFYRFLYGTYIRIIIYYKFEYKYVVRRNCHVAGVDVNLLIRINFLLYKYLFCLLYIAGLM
jgi:hypothetical protein